MAVYIAAAILVSTPFSHAAPVAFNWGGKEQKFLPHASDESSKRAIAFKPRPTDVIITTYPKTGTTMLMQACHQLRTGGDMTFSEITEVVPWIDFAWDLGQDLKSDQLAQPRVFKTHQRLAAINPGGKYLGTVRDPEKTLLSQFTFCKAHGIPPYDTTKDVNEYALNSFGGDGHFGANLWEFYMDLWRARHLPNVLVIAYESFVTDTDSHLRRITEFMGISSDHARLDVTAKMTTKQFMTEHADQFDDSFITKRGKELGRMKIELNTISKVGLASKEVVNAETTAWLQRMWENTITPETGFKSYQDMVAALRNLRDEL